MSYDTKPKKKTCKVSDEASSRIGKFIFGNEGFQIEYFMLSWLILPVFLNLLIYGFFLKKRKRKKEKEKRNKKEEVETHHKKGLGCFTF